MTYSITARLHDSIPAKTADRLLAEHLDRLDCALSSGELDAVRRAELELEYSRLFDSVLDRGYGSCVLADPRIAAIVLDTVMHFGEARYALEAVCVMPNHLHLILRPTGQWSLSSIMHSIKRHTSREANRILGKTGRNWQPEYYDRIIRNSTDLERSIRYVLDNPDKAGLGPAWRWVWPRKNAG